MVWDRDAVQNLIAGAIRRSINYVDPDHARATAETILREFKAAGIGLVDKKKRKQRQQE